MYYFLIGIAMIMYTEIVMGAIENASLYNSIKKDKNVKHKKVVYAMTIATMFFLWPFLLVGFFLWKGK